MTGPKKPNITSSFLFFTSALTTCSILIFGGVWFVNEQHLFKKESEQMQRQFKSAQEGELKQRVENMLSLITDLQTELEESVRRNVQQRTHEAWSVADNLCRINKERKSPSELAELVREALRPIRYNNGRGYYFATSLDGVEQLFADRPELEGKNLLDMRDANGKMVIQDMIRIAREHQEGFYEYVWTKPGVTEESHRKISYIKYHPTLDWFIGTGEYIDDAEVDLKAEVIRRIEYERFDNGGYTFSGTLDGVSLAGPAKGRNMLEVFDNNGVKIV
jgi:signal transduction histidine kinase